MERNKKAITALYEESINEGINELINTIQTAYGRELEEKEVQSILTIYKLGFDSGFRTGVHVLNESVEGNLVEDTDETT